MVALQQQAMAALKRRDDVGRQRADVGDEAEPAPTVCGAQLQRFLRIVWNSEWLKLEIAESDAFIAAHKSDQGRIKIRLALADGPPGTAAGVDRDSVLGRERQRAARVVAVLVRDEDGIQLRWR